MSVSYSLQGRYTSDGEHVRYFDLCDRYFVPDHILRDEFDWCEDEGGFFKANGTWYHLSQFMRLEHPIPLTCMVKDRNCDDDEEIPFSVEWCGIHHDSAFSGVVIGINSDDYDTIYVATYSVKG